MQQLAPDPGDNVRQVAAQDVTVVGQMFERGGMFWFAPGDPEANGTIFVLIDAGDQWWRGEDFWDGVFAPGPEAPPGLITPGGGFGLIWFMQDFEDVIGFATTGEQVSTGWYRALGDGWELRVGAERIELPADKQWMPPEPEPEPTPEPEPEPIPEPIPPAEPGWSILPMDPGWWVWLSELDMPVNLEHVVWVGVDRLRIGPHDIILTLPETTAIALRAYIKTHCVEII